MNVPDALASDLFYLHANVVLYNGDCVRVLGALPDASVDCVVTSPPYWGLHDYGVDGQIGLEPSLEAFLAAMGSVFDEVKRVLVDDGTLWLNLGDSYVTNSGGSNQHATGLHPSDRRHGNFAGRRRKVSLLKNKDLIGLPWRVAFALQNSGWYLRSDIVWHKPQCMPESVDDRPTKAHEYVFLMTKSPRYHYDAEAIRERVTGTAHPRHKNTPPHHKAAIADQKRVRGNARYAMTIKDTVEWSNKRTVWTVAQEKYDGAHFATFPRELIKPMILAGCKPGGVVLDPFAGSGTTLVVAKELGRRAVGIELNREYCTLAVERLRQDVLPLASGGAT